MHMDSTQPLWVENISVKTKTNVGRCHTFDPSDFLVVGDRIGQGSQDLHNQNINQNVTQNDAIEMRYKWRVQCTHGWDFLIGFAQQVFQVEQNNFTAVAVDKSRGHSRLFASPRTADTMHWVKNKKAINNQNTI